LGTFVSELQSDHSSLQGRQELAALTSDAPIEVRPAIIPKTLGALKDAIDRFGRLGAAIVIGGVTFAAADTVWAIQFGVSAPLAIAAAYCTVIATVCLAAVMAMLQKRPGPPREQPVIQRPAISGAWKLTQTFSVSDACRLMCDIEPGSMVTQDCIAWAKALLEAIERRELALVESAKPSGLLADRKAKPNWHSEITRDALKSWTQLRGISPQFLQD
jgi:hypothetical protein